MRAAPTRRGKCDTAPEHAVERNSNTATEHAARTPRKRPTHDQTTHRPQKRQKYDTATEHAERKTQKAEAGVLERAIAMREAQADRGDNSMANLVGKLSEFLCELLRQVWMLPGAGHATEPATSSSHASTWALLQSADRKVILLEDACEELVSEKIEEWARCSIRSQKHYDEQELLLHKKMFDIMTRNKEGLKREENMFIEWCRRVHVHSHVNASTATEHDEVGFKALARDILSNELTPQQKQDPKYKIREDESVTNAQRSTINSIL